jgi:hypothetical protein
MVFVDGQGIAHPRRLGLASHAGLVWNCHHQTMSAFPLSIPLG